MGLDTILRAIWGEDEPDLIQEEGINFTTSVTEVMQADPNRTQAYFANDTANTVRVGYDRNVTTSRGMVVPANGGTLKLTVRDEGRAITRSLFGIASAATTVYAQQYGILTAKPPRKVA